VHSMRVTDDTPLELPREIVIAGLRYRLEVVESLEDSLGPGAAEGAVGYTHMMRGVMRIRGASSQSRDQTRDSLLHEVMHATAYAVDVDLEEHEVRALTTCLLDTLRRNPDFARALVSE
jgi:hypothetical protein